MSTNRFARRDSRTLTRQQKLPFARRLGQFVSGKYRWGKNRKKRSGSSTGMWSRLGGLFKSKSVAPVTNETTNGQSVQQGFGRRLSYVAVLVVAVAIPVLLSLGYRYLSHTPSLSLREVQIEGNQRVSPSDIMDAGGLADGPNLLALDLAEVEAGLMSHSWIRAAKVERLLPDRLRIKVSERNPAVLLSMGALYLVDGQGELFARVPQGTNYGLPMVTGIERAQLLGERGIEQSERMQRFLRKAISLTNQWKGSELGATVQLSEVRIDPLLGYSVVLGDGAERGIGAVVRLGHQPKVAQFEKLGVVLTDVNRRQRSLAEVHLDDQRDPNRIAVRFRSESEREQELLEGEEVSGEVSYGQLRARTTTVAQGVNKVERD